MQEHRTKRCHACGQDLPLSAFSSNGKPKDRVTRTTKPCCRPCDAAFKRELRLDPVAGERLRAAQRAKYRRNPEANMRAAATWQAANRERVNANNRRTAKLRRAADPERHKAKGRREQLARRIGRNPESLAYADILLKDPCSFCGGVATTVDHIAPLRMGENNEWENLTAACAPCNSAKRDHPLLFFLGVRAGFWPAVRPGYWSGHESSPFEADGAAPSLAAQ